MKIIKIAFFTFIHSISCQGFTQITKPLTENVNTFLATLNASQLVKTNYVFEDSLRIKWSNLPIGMVLRPGIQYSSLSDSSRLAFHRVLTSVFSSQGYLKTTSIMQLDDILNTLYKEAFDAGKIKEKFLNQMLGLKWAHGNYYISIWGKPQASEPWGLNFGGHHLALNITVNGNNISFSPFFYGADPSEVKSSKYAGLRILSKEEDVGLILVNMLTEKQKAKAILKQNVPKDIITNPASSQRITSYYGISAKEMTSDQKAMLKVLINEYTHNFEHSIAHSLVAKIEKSGINKVYFAWVGSLESNKPHYYIINSPDLLIEYDNVGFANDGNHIHAITREKSNNFGEDILKNHYLETKH